MKDLDGFCAEYRISKDLAYAFMDADTFLDEVVANLDHWRATSFDVIKAIKTNAENSSRPDQLVWVLAYLRLVKHPGAQHLRDLVATPE
jgi:hypothetical protein